jgi:hypothetical protein
MSRPFSLAFAQANRELVVPLSIVEAQLFMEIGSLVTADKAFPGEVIVVPKVDPVESDQTLTSCTFTEPTLLAAFMARVEERRAEVAQSQHVA